MDKQKKRITIRDIAEKTGVSKSVVALALADRYGVNAETRNKVVMAALEMGYDFNKLKVKKHRKIVLMIYHEDFLKGLFWGEVIKELEAALYKENFVMTLSLWRNRNIEIVMSEVLSDKPHGIICLGEVTQHMLDKIKMLKIPIITLDPYKNIGSSLDCVKTNNIDGGFSIAKYVDSCGHKKICFLGNVSEVVSYKERFIGFKDFYEGKKGYKFYELIKGTENGDEFADYGALIKLLKTDDRPSVIVCANDRIAYSVYDVLNDLKLSIPDDVSVIGFDNMIAPARYVPSLTSVNIDKKQLAELTVELMQKRIESPDRINITIQISTTLIIKDSVKNLNVKGLL